jgi:hypothetical protein
MRFRSAAKAPGLDDSISQNVMTTRDRSCSRLIFQRHRLHDGRSFVSPREISYRITIDLTVNVTFVA